MEHAIRTWITDVLQNSILNIYEMITKYAYVAAHRGVSDYCRINASGLATKLNCLIF